LCAQAEFAPVALAKLLARAAKMKMVPGIDSGWEPHEEEEQEGQAQIYNPTAASSSGEPFIGGSRVPQHPWSTSKSGIKPDLDHRVGWDGKPSFDFQNGNARRPSDLSTDLDPSLSFMTTSSHLDPFSNSWNESFSDAHPGPELSLTLIPSRQNPAAAATRHHSSPPPPLAPGHMPSIGSWNHTNDGCMPCKFHRGRRGCKDGDQCAMCHFPHEELTHAGIRKVMRKKGLEKRKQIAAESDEAENLVGLAPSAHDVNKAFGATTRLSALFGGTSQTDSASSTAAAGEHVPPPPPLAPGQLLSIGSSSHADGDCVPCKFIFQ